MAPSMRVRWAVIPILFSSAFAAAAGESVTEAEAVRLFLERSPQARRIAATARSAGAERLQAALPPNPEVAYQVEEAAGVRDAFLTLQQELPITGRRGLTRRSAGAASAAAGLAAVRDLQVATATLRTSFHEVLYREAVLERLRGSAERLARIVEILAIRERAGEGSGYDLLRAEQERAEIGIATLEVESAASAARARFGAFFVPERKMEAASLEGNLMPTGEPPETEEAIALAMAHRGDLKALQVEERRLDLDRRAARRQRFPEPTLTAGWKRTESLGLGDTGFVASLTVPLPVFDRGQAAAAGAAAEQERAALEAEILEGEIRAEVRAALAREGAAREAARRHGGDVDRRAGDLRRIADLAYEEGEAGILELLDAHKTSLAAELRALAVLHEAKRAEIDRDRAIGVEVNR